MCKRRGVGSFDWKQEHQIIKKPNVFVPRPQRLNSLCVPLGRQLTVVGQI
jgi:hypothetical protein